MRWVRQRALCGLYFVVAERWGIEEGSSPGALQAWTSIPERRLRGRGLWISGVALLLLMSIARSNSVVARLVGKWKGWMRPRTNPALMAFQEDSFDDRDCAFYAQVCVADH